MTWSWTAAATGTSTAGTLLSGWTQTRVGDIAKLVNGLPYDSKGFGDSGLPLIRIRDLAATDITTRYEGPELTPHRVSSSALLVGMDGDFNVGRWRHAEPALLNQRVLSLESESLDNEWLEYTLPFALQVINDLTYSTTVKHLSSADVAKIRIPYPDRNGLRKIVDYLDHETAEIDALISDLEQTHLLRQELWKVTRDNLLTSGAQASNPVQTVESTWLGSMGSMWQEGPFKRLFDVSLGKMLDEKRHAGGDELLPYVRAGNIEDGRLNLENLKTMPFNSREQSTYDLQKGDMLIVEGGSVGTNVVLDADLDGIFFQKTVNRARAHSDASPHFYSEVLNAYRDRGVFDVVANKSTIMHLTAEKLANLEVPIPPFETQHLIVALLQTQRTELDFMAADMSAAVAMAQERRTALISAAVTGQIDVTGRRRGPSEAERLEDEISTTR